MPTLNEQIHETFEGKDLEKALALAEVLELDLNGEGQIFKTQWNNKVFHADGGEYLVVDEDEREIIIKEEVREKLWAFNSQFLAEATDWDLEPVFEVLAKSDMCEGANEAILAIVEKFTTLEKIIDLAVSYDGYGHYLSNYDGEEQDANVGENYYLIYRQN